MTRRSILEYAGAVRTRYAGAGKAEKGRILDELTKVTGLHRKAAIRLLAQRHRVASQKRGRPRRYSLEARAALSTVWEVSDHVCSKRLRPFLPELVSAMKRHGEMAISPEAERQLLDMSSSTIDRVLHPLRLRVKRRPFSMTKPGTLLKSAIPIRTFGDWTEHEPGFLEIDLVAHCGESAEGFYLYTLSAVDVASGWQECVPVWGKGQSRVGSAVHQLHQRLPFSILGLDSDNGGEFINRAMVDYCDRHHIKFTRSRSYKKNDSCHVEQKNWSVVRRLVGYDRFTSKMAFAALRDVYELVRLYVNFFQPTAKLLRKKRQGARVYKVYDTAQTPYQRLLRSNTLSAEKRREMEAVYNALNPAVLRRQMQERLERLWTLAQRHPY